MKFLSKRGLALFIAIVMMLMMSVGCQTNKDDKQNDTKTSTNSSNNEATKKDSPEETPMKIEWLAYNSHAQPDEDSPILKFVEEEFNVDVDYWYIDSNNEDALNVKLMSGEMPDVMRIKSLEKIGEYVEQGILAELPEETIRKYAPNMSKVIDEYNTSGMAWKYGYYNGKNYTFPKINIDGSYPTVMVWNQNWLDNLGVSLPTTLDEFEDVMYKIAKEDPDGDNVDNTYGISDTGMPAIFGAFGLYMDPLTKPKISFMVKDDKAVITDIQPEAKEALKVLRKWYADGVVDPEFITKENSGGYWGYSHAFMNGRVGYTGNVMFYHYYVPQTSDEKPGGCLNETLKVNPDMKIAFGTPPVGPNGKAGTPKWGAMGEGIAITTEAAKDEKKVERILKMFDRAFDPNEEEYAKMVLWGVEGEHYKMDGDKMVSLLDPKIKIDHYSIGTLTTPVPAIRKQSQKTTYQFADQVANFEGYEKIKLPTSEEMAKYMSQLGTLKQEAYIEIITGSKDLDYFDEFVKTFNEYGGAIVQQELDRIYESLK